MVLDQKLLKIYICKYWLGINFELNGNSGQGYQFWTRANEEGYFSIDNIRSGDYNLFAWVPGFIGEYWNNVLLTITPGSSIYIYLGSESVATKLGSNVSSF